MLSVKGFLISVSKGSKRDRRHTSAQKFMPVPTMKACLPVSQQKVGNSCDASAKQCCCMMDMKFMGLDISFYYLYWCKINNMRDIFLKAFL